MRIVLLCFLFSLISEGLVAQQNKSDRIYFGGGVGFSSGSNTTNLSLSPQVGYKITERLSAGIGLTYQYVKFRLVSSSINNYGWSVFTRCTITQQFFAYSEFENLQFEYFTSISPERTERDTYNSLLMGGGYSESISGRTSFSMSVLYNVLYDPSDPIQPYNSPWVIRAGLGIGIL